MHTPRLAAAALLLALPGIGQAAEPPCLTRSEFSDLAGYALPSAIGGAAARCEASLPAGAFLTNGGEQLVRHYEARKNEIWPSAKAIFLKLSAKSDKQAYDLLAKLPDETLQEMLGLMIEGLVTQEIAPEKCGAIDDAVRLLAPLPPKNTADLIGPAIILISHRDKIEPGVAGRLGKFKICQEEP